MTLHEKALKITTLLLDVDGVLTDGRIGFGGGSPEEIKFFDVHDGQILRIAQRSGIKLGVLSGRCSQANRTRLQDLNFDFVVEGCKQKRDGFLKLLEEQHLSAEEIMYIGDDVVDAPVLMRCGVAVTVANGIAELDRICDFRTKAPGGHGGVREAVEWLLKEQDKWQDVIEHYFS